MCECQTLGATNFGDPTPMNSHSPLLEALTSLRSSLIPKWVLMLDICASKHQQRDYMHKFTKRLHVSMEHQHYATHDI